MSRAKIKYSQCWEDPRPSLEALEIGPEDDVLSIASGGDNSFALLLGGPRSVTIVDRNPAQMHLVELKMKAVEQLNYDELLRFVGILSSPDRLKAYAALRPSLSGAARDFWDGRRKIIGHGIVFAGKYERFFRILRRCVLPFVHRKQTTQAFLSCSTIEEQMDFYEKIWENRRWQVLFRRFFGKQILGRLGRDLSFYRYVTISDTGDYFYRRIPRMLAAMPIRENTFFAFLFAGNYLWPESYPLWLRKETFPILKERLGRIRLVAGTLDDVLTGRPPGAFSKYNLSNIFEYMSESEFEGTLGQLLRVSRSGARLAFWTLFVARPIPASLAGRIVSDPALEGRPPVFYPRSPAEDFWLWRIP